MHSREPTNIVQLVQLQIILVLTKYLHSFYVAFIDVFVLNMASSSVLYVVLSCHSSHDVLYSLLITVALTHYLFVTFVSV